MYDYFLGDNPWYIENSNIKTIVIEEGVTDVGAIAFTPCTEVNNVTISNYLTFVC